MDYSSELSEASQASFYSDYTTGNALVLLGELVLLLVVVPLVLLLCLVLVLGYPLVVIVGLKHVNLRIVPYLYVLHLAVSQISILFISLAYVCEAFSQSEEEFVEMLAFITLHNLTTELIVFVITLDRFMLHYQPQIWANNFRNVVGARVAMGAVWILGVTAAASEYIHLKSIPFKDAKGYLQNKMSWDDSTGIHYALLVVRILSLGLFVLSAVKSFLRPPPTRNGSLAVQGGSGASGTVEDEPQVVNKFVMFIVAGYVVLPLPTLLVEVVAATYGLEGDSRHDLRQSEQYYLFALGVVCTLKALTTPLICYFMTSEYEMGLGKLCSCRKPKPTSEVTYRRQTNRAIPDEEHVRDRRESQGSTGSLEPLFTVELF